jgi:predicted NAD/FAD-dependent oxidoreductase
LASFHTAVIGAGISGMTCAAALAEAGVEVVVFDKGRGLGGRLATRRRNGLQWDHGAQYLTAETSEFALWLDRLPVWSATGRENWHVGAPSQNALVKLWTEGLDIRLGTRVTTITRRDSRWAMITEAGPVTERFDALAIAAPAPQTAELLPPGFRIDGLGAVVMQPCWTLMVGTAQPLDVPPYLEQPHSDLAWIAADQTKPGRNEARGQYVVHASRAWSRRHLEIDADEAAKCLLDRFLAALNVEVEIIDTQAHRWRYALTEQPLGRPCHYEPGSRLGVAGDWCLGQKAEHAYLSGRALARQILEDLHENGHRDDPCI